LHRLQAQTGRRAEKGRDGASQGLRILGYHRVSAARDELAVTPAAFRAQMETLIEARLEPVALDDALGRLDERPTGRYVCVTFDDGYRDVLDHAVPVLRELQIPATIFVPSGPISGTARLYWYKQQPPLLSWSEVRELARDELFEVGAHTRTHPALPQIPNEAAWQEIAGSKLDIEEKIGDQVTSFAYPAGLCGEREMRMVREAGYDIGLTTQPGVNKPGQPPQALYRTFIGRRDNPSVFEARITGLLDDPWGLQYVSGRLGRRRQTGTR
jgi:peptidoglycan/xylan/chitin deacetylase (PgdA/CDA1 family)